jgi:carbonic anhydrase
VVQDHEAAHGGEHAGPPVSADEALRRLIEGNGRYLRGESRFTGLRPEMLDELATGQRPFATILGCADSRVPPELIFDAVLGELFVVRVAGNVLSPEVAGSLQYAGSHLQTPLFVVFGHEGCGAVQAALQSRLLGVQHRSRIQILVASIVPAIEGVDASLPPQEQLARAVEANVRWQLGVIRDSPEGQARAAAGDFKLVGAIYDLRSGRVRWMEA